MGEKDYHGTKEWVFKEPHDCLDTESNILYCSAKCAREAGAKKTRRVYSKEFEAQYNAETGDHWGACCPTCEEQYNNY